MKTRIKVHKTNGDHHRYIEWIEKLGLGYLPVEDRRKRRTNDECRRTVYNLRVITHGNVSETLRKRLGLDFLHENNFPQQFSDNTKCQEGWTPSFFIPPPIYSKIREKLATQLAQASSAHQGEPGCFLQKQPPSGGRIWKAQVGLIAICTLFLLNTPPLLFLVILFP